MRNRRSCLAGQKCSPSAITIDWRGRPIIVTIARLRRWLDSALNRPQRCFLVMEIDLVAEFCRLERCDGRNLCIRQIAKALESHAARLAVRSDLILEVGIHARIGQSFTLTPRSQRLQHQKRLVGLEQLLQPRPHVGAIAEATAVCWRIDEPSRFHRLLFGLADIEGESATLAIASDSAHGDSMRFNLDSFLPQFQGGSLRGPLGALLEDSFPRPAK